MPLLTTHNLTAFYGDFQALFGVDIELNAGETRYHRRKWGGKNLPHAINFRRVEQCIGECYV